MIFKLLIIHNYDRMSSITRVVHTTTWCYFIPCLGRRFIDSQKEVKEVIMTDVNDLVQEFWMTSSDGLGAVGTSFIAMRRLLRILEECFYRMKVCFDIIYVVDLADEILQPWQYSAQSLDVLNGYRKMIDQSFFKSKDLGDMLRFPPGVVVQNPLTMQGMADLYRIKPDLLERLIKFTIKPLRAVYGSPPLYKMDIYLSRFLQDRDRSQLYYCDPVLQHISICRHFLSFLDESIVSDLQS